MNAKELRVICVGIGAMGKAGIRTLLDHKVPIVAAVDTWEGITGKDVGRLAGYSECGVYVEQDLKTAIGRAHPNVAWVASDPGIDHLRDVLLLCAENKINVAMIPMEPSYRVDVYAGWYDEIDAAFRKNGVSCFASGTQDVWWSGIGLDLIGACKRVDAINTTAVLPLQGQGIGSCAEFRINEEPDDFLAEVGGVDFSGSPDTTMIAPLMSLLVNARVLGLHPTARSVRMEPIAAKEDFDMKEWNMVIKRGKIIGQKHTFEVLTEEDIPLTYHMIIKCLEPGDKAGTSWTITGEPTLHCELGDIFGEITTSATAINRIPQIVKGRPGILTQADILERPIYHHGEWKEI